MIFTDAQRKQFVADVYNGATAGDLVRSYGCSLPTAAEYRRRIRSGKMRSPAWQKAIAHVKQNKAKYEAERAAELMKVTPDDPRYNGVVPLITESLPPRKVVVGERAQEPPTKAIHTVFDDTGKKLGETTTTTADWKNGNIELFAGAIARSERVGLIRKMWRFLW